MTDQPVIQTGQLGLSLRCLVSSDFSALVAVVYRNRKDLDFWFDRSSLGITNVDFARRCINDLAAPDRVCWGIWYFNELVGVIHFQPAPMNACFSQIGYWVAKEFRGRGIATASLISMIDHVFAFPYATHIYCDVIVGNNASAKVLTKAGFRHQREVAN